MVFLMNQPPLGADQAAFNILVLSACTLACCHPAIAQQSWSIPGYSVQGNLRAGSSTTAKGHSTNSHTFKCWEYREPGSQQIPPRSCGVGGGVVVRVNSGMFRPSITVKSPEDITVGTDSNEVEFCPKSPGVYRVEVSSRHRGTGGPYSLEVIYMPSCQMQ